MLKDHNNDSIQESLAKSQARTLRLAATNEGIDLGGVSVTDGVNYSTSTITTLWLTSRLDTQVVESLKEAAVLIKPLMKVHLVNKCEQG